MPRRHKPKAIPHNSKCRYGERGTEVEIRDKKGNAETVTVIGDVPYGHKIAVRDIKKGELINKYGEEIGIATKDIKKGEYVHVHNLDSMRGRGDWAKEGK